MAWLDESFSTKPIIYGFRPFRRDQYLDDPRDAFENVDDAATLTTVVNEELSEDDPVAYAFLNALTFDEEQVNDLEYMINEIGDPLEGARQWAEDNSDVVEPWIEAAQDAQR